MKKYLHLIKISFINTLDYRQELVTNFVNSMLIFAAMALFWRALFIGRDEVKGFDFAEIIQYYIFLNIVIDIVDSQFAFMISKEVIKGSVSNLFLKPVNIKLWYMVRELGQILPLILIKLIIMGGAYLLLIGDFSVEWRYLPLLFVMLPLSYLINANIYFMIGCLAFWVADIKGLIYGIRRLFIFLSGGYIPIVFFPDILRHVVELLPFGYVFALPMRILTEGLIIQDLPEIGLLIIWALVMSVLTNKFFKYSYKSNESVGI